MAINYRCKASVDPRKRAPFDRRTATKQLPSLHSHRAVGVSCRPAQPPKPLRIWSALQLVRVRAEQKRTMPRDPPREQVRRRDPQRQDLGIYGTHRLYRGFRSSIVKQTQLTRVGFAHLGGREPSKQSCPFFLLLLFLVGHRPIEALPELCCPHHDDYYSVCRRAAIVGRRKVTRSAGLA